MRTITLLVNGRRERIAVDNDRRLLWVLRTDLGLTGTKYGCGSGLCGACTVIVGTQAVRSCMATAASLDGEEIRTVEGLGSGGHLDPLQEAFVAHEAFQCGFCTPGMLMAACALLRAVPHPTREQIVERLDRNLCRCGAQPRILAAVGDIAARQERS